MRCCIERVKGTGQVRLTWVSMQLELVLTPGEPTGLPLHKGFAKTPSGNNLIPFCPSFVRGSTASCHWYLARFLISSDLPEAVDTAPPGGEAVICATQPCNTLWDLAIPPELGVSRFYVCLFLLLSICFRRRRINCLVTIGARRC